MFKIASQKSEILIQNRPCYIDSLFITQTETFLKNFVQTFTSLSEFEPRTLYLSNFACDILILKHSGGNES